MFNVDFPFKSNSEKCNEKGGDDKEIEVVDLEEIKDSAKENVPQVSKSANQGGRCEGRENKKNDDKTRKKEFVKGMKKIGKKKNKINQKKSFSKKFRKTHVD